MGRCNTLFLIAIFAVVALVGCTAGPNALLHTPAGDGDVAGFWMGLWNGIIAPVAFVVSLFTDNISLYEVHNNGGWYDFGFVLGAGILFGSGGLRARKRKRHWD